MGVLRYYKICSLYLCYLFFLLGFCASALPAADFDVLLVLPSLRVFEAAVAAFLDVCFFGDLVCDKALPAAALDFLPVDLLVKVFDALLAAFSPVTFLFMTSTPLRLNMMSLR